MHGTDGTGQVMTVARRRAIRGWYLFDWAAQPAATLLLTFVFGPYIAEILGDGSRAQAAWGWGVAAAGVTIALTAPVLGAIADAGGNRRRWIAAFSGLYVAGAWGLWFATPADPHLVAVLLSFALALIGVELATIFTNAMLPGLAPPDRIGRVSGNGWAIGYLGGLASLLIMLILFTENGATGRTVIGIPPILGLDPALREGTRAVGPFSALWYLVFILPFALWTRDPPQSDATRTTVAEALAGLRRTLVTLPGQRTLSAFLLSSMLYRDALNGLYAFGGIYAAGVLGWTVTQVGIFGILAIVSGAAAAFAGGRADDAFGPKPVIVTSVALLAAATLAIVFVSPERVLWVTVPEGSGLPDAAFYAVGILVGGGGGALQTASRTMMTRLADPARMTEAFGLYALAGKATSFLAPAMVALVTGVTGSQAAGIVPIILLFLSGLILLAWVKMEGGRAG